MRHFKIVYDDGVWAGTISFDNKSDRFIEKYLKKEIARFNENINKSYHITRANIKEVLSGCDYCDDNFQFWQAEICGSLPNVKYCPMCGRKLKED